MGTGEKTQAGPRGLAGIFASHSGNIAYKWQQYIPIYETEFRRFVEKGEPVSLLEIGVMNGGSLEIWREYLPNGSRILGLDVNPDCARLTIGDGIEVSIGDATDRHVVDRLLGDRTFAIIVDDGSHRCSDVIATFANLFHRLDYGGIYVIEDCHTSYWEGYEGGYLKPDSTIEWAKTLADVVNYDHIDPAQVSDESMGSRLKGLNREVGRVAFYDSLVVIEKHAAPKEGPYQAFIVGQQAPVLDIGKNSGLLRRTMLGPLLLKRIETEILDSLEAERARSANQTSRLAGYEARLESLLRQVEVQQTELARQTGEKERLSNRNQRLLAKLRRVKDAYRKTTRSIAWRLLGWRTQADRARRSRRA